MSQHLKGEQKQAVFENIRKYMAYRMTEEEMLLNLKNLGHEISGRTLRRFKLEIKQKSGNTFSEIYQNEILNNVVEDIFAIREIQYQSWKEYAKSRVPHDKIKALSLIRNTILDKLKLYDHIPHKFRNEDLKQNIDDIDKDEPGEEQKDLKD